MELERMTGRLGARVRGVDLARPLDAATIVAIRAARNEYGVLFFQDQPRLSGDELYRAMAQFGAVHVSEFRSLAASRPEVILLDQATPKGEGTDLWHSDSTYLANPPTAGMLQAQVLPETGGDTCFCSMAAAYEGLSPAMRRLLDSLSARHWHVAAIQRTRAPKDQKVEDSVAARPPAVHPVVVVNAETGRRAIFVNPAWTIAIDGLDRAESDSLLALLYAQAKSPEYQLRYRWSLNDIAFWDNYMVQHYAVPDYTSRRVMQGIRSDGAAPLGVRAAEPVPA
jgi:taurine dioxygenase